MYRFFNLAKVLDMNLWHKANASQKLSLLYLFPLFVEQIILFIVSYRPQGIILNLADFSLFFANPYRPTSKHCRVQTIHEFFYSCCTSHQNCIGSQVIWAVFRGLGISCHALCIVSVFRCFSSINFQIPSWIRINSVIWFSVFHRRAV